MDGGEVLVSECVGEWTRGPVIGRGAHGTVYVGTLRATQERIAVKEVVIQDMSEGDVAAVKNEIDVIREAQHPHIVQYLGAERHPSKPGLFHIFLEFVEGGSLRHLLKEEGALPEALIALFSRQMLLGLHYLHAAGITHRDVKAANVLVCGDRGAIKLADFSDAKHVSATSFVSGLKGTPHWMAPEVVRGDLMNALGWKSADLWSVGCTVVEMATGAMPWPDLPNPIAAMFHIATTPAPPPMPDDLSPCLSRFIARCCDPDPQRRPSAKALLDDPFLVRHLGRTSPAAILFPPAPGAPPAPWQAAGGGPRPQRRPSKAHGDRRRRQRHHAAPHARSGRRKVPLTAPPAPQKGTLRARQRLPKPIPSPAYLRTLAQSEAQRPGARARRPGQGAGCAEWGERGERGEYGGCGGYGEYGEEGEYGEGGEHGEGAELGEYGEYGECGEGGECGECGDYGD